MEFVEVSDVVVENFRPGVMSGFGLDYESLKAVNPDIIMCSISGWGQTGPQAGFTGIDILIQSLRGIADMSSVPGERPVFISFAVSDILAGLNAFGAICAALYRRGVTGQGEYIDVGKADCALAALGNSVGAHILSEGKAEFRYMAGS
ncbi:CoA transferase [Chloroflexota bacterium]